MGTETTCAVVVVGGGTAGVLAAVAAARAGADTLLLESSQHLGGIGQAQFHRHICGLYANGGDEPGEPLHGPLVAEVLERLRLRSGVRGPDRMDQTWVWPLLAGDLESVLAELLRETSGLRTWRGWSVTRFTLDRATRQPVLTASGPEGDIGIRAGAAVDATGSAALAQLANWPREETHAGYRDLAGLTIDLERIVIRDPLLALHVPRVLAEACDRGELPAEARFVTLLPGAPDGAALRLNLPDHHAEAYARQLARDALAVLQQALPALAPARIAATSPLTARDSGRVHGRYRLTATDVHEARRKPDAVARGAWPMESWLPGHGPTYTFGPPGEAYDIPLRCLLSPASERVLFAGRAISCDPEAFSSIRAMGTCMGTGLAAGQEAARRAT
jgi:2-polyprenyl-6-methoxyphenol hydroxylase-like FAD-dependent oxidoreductase